MNNTSSPTTSDDATTRFFEELGRRGNEPLLRRVSGRIRFEIVDGERTDSWLVAVDQGRLSVTHEQATADCTIRGGRSTFDELAAGRRNMNAALVRGALAARGDLELFFAIQRLFPNPPPGWDPTAETRGES
ncbi:SCP2 sterol-binding domain-containing protein [Diaminobutyricimonas sp. TR449]|uniref:SCP2 sterol-binding domain-containing protein n=1 Tax=Diaminobutyricimonas sp. TR449 TaxID=2708076 RepID=UPI00142227A7|nr:SCP2 sterol-binding domain-containing protein [Diaminobutyricimonas sp. TR449]